MLDGKFEVFDDARGFMKRSRPIFVEKHDFSAKLFKNKQATEPSFSLAACGEHTVDIYKIVGGVILFFIWFCSTSLYFSVRRARRRRKKELKKAMRQKKK